MTIITTIQGYLISLYILELLKEENSHNPNFNTAIEINDKVIKLCREEKKLINPIRLLRNI